ncbi:MAG: hypothetical protein K2L93_08005 [Muribaculaceae bacterium]|nr:hypothetical protein [Muribaculaceae bacterium]MDE6322225.1 hypothetical protein [Muribaculaceae bacterium]
MSDLLKKHELKPKAWRGYTLDELRYRRALTEVAIEIERDRITQSITDTVPNALKGRSSGPSMMSKVFGALNYVDYAVLGWRLIKMVRGLRRKK